MASLNNRPQVGIGVYIINDGKILLGHRTGSHGTNTWSPPGGHLEHGESFAECSQRETLEEAGITIKNIQNIATTNDMIDNKHYVTIHMQAEPLTMNINITELDKWAEWKWFNLNDLPNPLFGASEAVIKEYII